MKLTAKIFLGFIVLIVASCAKLQIVNAPLEKQDINLVQFARYDAGSKIRYMVSNDATHIYLRFDTDNRGTMLRIRKTGAIVRFDTEGKKKGKTWLKYPIYGIGQTIGNDSKEEIQTPGMYGLRNFFPPSTSAIWQDGEESRSIDLGVSDEGLICSAAVDSIGTFEYRVGVPFKMLGGNGPADFPKLAVCLEIPNPGGPKSSGSSPMPSTMNNSANSMPGGTNSNLPGPNGGLTTGSMSSGGVSPSEPTIKIWMEVKLHQVQ